ncbi:hypothetical protein SOVF_152960 isoform C [Spinacia oleracea]|nr:hypothetical protein SOVF_152960 isoform C [Spinacia oleracea]
MGQIIEFLTLRRLLFSSGSNLKISWVVHPEWLKDEVKATRKQKEVLELKKTISFSSFWPNT